jgi:hypothetical protein
LYYIGQENMVLSADPILLIVLFKAFTNVLAFHAFFDPKANPNDSSPKQPQFRWATDH